MQKLVPFLRDEKLKMIQSVILNEVNVAQHDMNVVLNILRHYASADPLTT